MAMAFYRRHCQVSSVSGWMADGEASFQFQRQMERGQKRLPASGGHEGDDASWRVEDIIINHPSRSAVLLSPLVRQRRLCVLNDSSIHVRRSASASASVAARRRPLAGGGSSDVLIGPEEVAILVDRREDVKVRCGETPNIVMGRDLTLRNGETDSLSLTVQRVPTSACEAESNASRFSFNTCNGALGNVG